MRSDTRITLTVFILLLVAMAVLSFIGWDRWSDLALP